MNPKAVRKHAVYFSDYRTNSNMLPGHVMLQFMKSAFGLHPLSGRELLKPLKFLK